MRRYWASETRNKVITALDSQAQAHVRIENEANSNDVDNFR